MKRLSCVALATGFFALSAPADSSAQTSIFVGGGATFPVGSIASSGFFVGADTGWQGTAGAQFAIGASGFTVGPRLYFGTNKSETPGNNSNVYGGMALANFNFGEPDAAAGYTSDLGGDIDMTYFGLYAGLSFALGGG